LIPLAALAIVVLAAVIAEIALPGKAVYHAGWYNVALTGLIAVSIFVARRTFAAIPGVRRRAGAVAVAFGTIAAGVAGVASGLLGPDDQSVVGAPGQRVRVEGLGTLDFPIADSSTAAVTLERPLRGSLQVGTGARNAGSFILRASPRDVVYVEARDLRGNRLTITQPTGSVFLSPVLLMEHRQTIAGMDLPFDSFNVPAARRVVKAVLFSPAQAAMLSRSAEIGEPAVLFAVDDQNDRPLPHAIALSAGGKPVKAGGLTLRGRVTSYPAVDVMSAPNLAAVLASALLVAGGLIALL
jgi:hypothetical protein